MFILRPRRCSIGRVSADTISLVDNIEIKSTVASAPSEAPIASVAMVVTVVVIVEINVVVFTIVMSRYKRYGGSLNSHRGPEVAGYYGTPRVAHTLGRNRFMKREAIGMTLLIFRRLVMGDP